MSDDKILTVLTDIRNWTRAASYSSVKTLLEQALPQYSSLNDPDSRADFDDGQALVTAAQWVVAHLSLDPSGIAAVAAGAGGLVENFLQHRVMELFAAPRGE